MYADRLSRKHPWPSMNKGLKPLVAIVGNTGSGKSQFAVDLAKALNGEIINGDAMQMYQGLEVITNKHPIKERDNIPHHLIGFESWNSQLTVQDFVSKATKIISGIHARGKLPILVGGTHYYIQSLIAENTLISSSTYQEGSQSQLPSAKSLPEKALTEAQQIILDDPEKVESLLQEVDPMILSKFHPNDTRRLRRALEIWFDTNKLPSQLYETQQSGPDELKLKPRYRTFTIWMYTRRDVLVKRLDARVSKMIESGLLQEIEELFNQYDPEKLDHGIWQVIGFRQFLPYLKENNEVTWKAGVDAMQAETRQYAKKQTQWIRNKLRPFVSSLGGHFGLLDSSDLRTWDSVVKDRGVALVEQWCNDVESKEPLIPAALADEVARRRQTYSKDQWVRHHCKTCSQLKNTPVVLMGDAEWEIHCSSKAHRAALNRFGRLSIDEAADASQNSH